MSKTFKNLLDLGGLVSDRPEDKIPERNASDIANIDMASRGLIMTKKGKDIFGHTTNGVGVNSRGFLFKKNFGTLLNVKVRVIDDGSNGTLQWFNPNNTTNSPDGQWELLVGSLTTGALMGFAIANGNNANKENLLVFCNAVENFSTWNGATATVASVTSNTIVAEETLATAGDQEGFDTSGSVLVNGTEYAYTGITAKTFTGVTPDPTVQNPSAGEGIAQKPDTTTHSSNPKGNILVTSQRKLFLSGVADNESKVHYTKTSDVTDFTITSGLGSGGTFDIIEGGGPIKAAEARGKNGILFHKENALILYTRDNDGTNAIESFETIAPGGDSGAVNIKAIAGINQSSFHVTKREGLKNLAKAINDSSLNLDSISDIILPTIEKYDNSSAAAVYYPAKRAIFVATKSSSDKTVNDKLISYYIRKPIFGDDTIIDISIDDDFIADFIVDGEDLFYLSSIDQNMYKAFGRKSNNGVSINHKWATKELTFAEPARGKDFNIVYLEGFIGVGTKIKVTCLYDLLGSGGTKSVILEWDNSLYVNQQKISALGTDKLGEVSLGASSADIKDSFAFSVPIHFDINKATRYKIKLETIYDSETIAESFWAISNMATNPDLKSIDNNKILNSN